MEETHRGHFLIPAGVLIGLGVGLLFVTRPAPGCSSASAWDSWDPRSLHPWALPRTQRHRPPCIGPRWISVIIGVFIILLGLWIVWGPPLPWTSIIALLLILLGIGFIARGFGRMR